MYPDTHYIVQASPVYGRPRGEQSRLALLRPARHDADLTTTVPSSACSLLSQPQVNITHLAITILSLFVTFFGLFSCVPWSLRFPTWSR
jgi:hypothetical protein